MASSARLKPVEQPKKELKEENVEEEEPCGSASGDVSSLTNRNELCVLCEKVLVSGCFFAVPVLWPELKYWAQGLFPGKPTEFGLFTEHIRILDRDTIPYLCIDHFAKDDIVRKPGMPVRLRPCALPIKYPGTMRQRKNRQWRKNKCIVCGALRLSDEMYPFSQKESIRDSWCYQLFPGDLYTADKMKIKVARSPNPVLCGDHFDKACFDRNGDLMPNAIPTQMHINPSSKVMSLLTKANADLNKVVPGNFVPRRHFWESAFKEQRVQKDEKKRTAEKRPTMTGMGPPRKVPFASRLTIVRKEDLPSNATTSDGASSSSVNPSPSAQNLRKEVKEEMEESMDDKKGVHPLDDASSSNSSTTLQESVKNAVETKTRAEM